MRASPGSDVSGTGFILREGLGVRESGWNLTRGLTRFGNDYGLGIGAGDSLLWAVS